MEGKADEGGMTVEGVIGREIEGRIDGASASDIE